MRCSRGITASARVRGEIASSRPNASAEVALALRTPDPVAPRSSADSGRGESLGLMWANLLKIPNRLLANLTCSADGAVTCYINARPNKLRAHEVDQARAIVRYTHH